MANHCIINFGILSFFGLFLAGCGSNTSPNLTTVSTLEDSLPCISCHQSSAVSSVTGESITASWQQSAHNTASSANRSGKGASCADCHEPEAGHPNSCSICHGGGTPSNSPLVQHNPDRSMKCDRCHNLASTVHPLDSKHYNPSSAHFNNYTASFVSSRFIGNCRGCHDPHSTTSHMKENREWSESGHGDHTAQPWNYYDFKTLGTKSPASPANSVASDCVRCHTATGYINYVTSSFKNISGWGKQNINGRFPATYNTVDTSKQVLACPACHDDGKGNSYSYMVRQVAPVTAYYNYSSPQTKKMLISFPYPDLSNSNVCVACHSGRQIGATVSAAGTGAVPDGINLGITPAWSSLDFRNIGFVNSHYLTAGATVFSVSGYHFPGQTYENPLFEHDQIGMGNYKGTGNKGPCVTCHMSSPTKHRFLPITRAEGKWSPITGIISSACDSCHPSPRNWSATTLQELKSGYEAALAALYQQLRLRGFYFSAHNPYFFTADYDESYIEATASPHCQKNLVTKNWQTDGTSTFSWNSTTNSCVSAVSTAGIAATGVNNMGAAFNYNMLEHDPGAFAHNSHYVKRLIYDSIDWLDNNLMDDSTGVTINSLPIAGDEKTKAINYLLH